MVALAAILAGSEMVGAQEAQDGSSSLQERMDELELQNKELRERVDSLEGDAGAGEETAEEAEQRQGLSVRYGDVNATFMLFGDVGATYQNPEEEDRSHTMFAIGSATVFSSVRLGDHGQALSETVIEGSGNDARFSQERLWGAWIFDDALRVKFGLEHNPISWWNKTYHHGRWLEPTIKRPFLTRYEGDGGILPLHNMGIELGGRLYSDCCRMEYFAILANGRGVAPTDKQRATDRNEGKSVDLGFSVQPEAASDLEVGMAFRTDTIPDDPTSMDPARSKGIRALLGTSFFTYQCGSLNLLGEFAYINHRTRASERTYDHHSWYIQAQYEMEDWSPYTRFDYQNMESGDPFYQPKNRDLDRWQQIFGVRYDLMSHAAVKFELGYGRTERRGGGGRVSRGSLVTAAMQISWMF